MPETDPIVLSNTDGLTRLGSSTAPQEVTSAFDRLEVIQLQTPVHDQLNVVVTPEFTSKGPLNAQRDFGVLQIALFPNELVPEAKSLRECFAWYDDKQIFYEDFATEVVQSLSRLLKPHYLRFTAAFNTRGGMSTDVMQMWRNPDIDDAQEQRYLRLLQGYDVVAGKIRR